MKYKGVDSVCMSVYCNFHRERGQNGQAIPRGLTLTWLGQCWVQWCVEVDGDRHACQSLVQKQFLSFVFYLSFFLQDTRQQLNFLGGRGWGSWSEGHNIYIAAARLSLSYFFLVLRPGIRGCAARHIYEERLAPRRSMETKGGGINERNDEQTMLYGAEAT